MIFKRSNLLAFIQSCRVSLEGIDSFCIEKPNVNWAESNQHSGVRSLLGFLKVGNSPTNDFSSQRAYIYIYNSSMRTFRTLPCPAVKKTVLNGAKTESGFFFKVSHSISLCKFIQN